MLNTTDAAYILKRVFQVYLTYLKMDTSRRVRVGSFDRYLSQELVLGAGDQLVRRGTFFYTLIQPINRLRDTFQGGEDTDTRRRRLVADALHTFEEGLRALETRRYQDQVTKLKQIVSEKTPIKDFDRLWEHLRIELMVFSKDIRAIKKDIRDKGELFHRQLDQQHVLERKEDINDLDVLFQLISYIAEQESDVEILHALHNELVELLNARGMGLRGQEEEQTLFAAGDLLGDLAEVYAAGVKEELKWPPTPELAKKLSWGLSESSFLSLMVALSHHATQLRVIAIDGRAIQHKLLDSAMSALSDVIKKNPRLKVLDLRYHRITEKGFMRLRGGIAAARQLEAIILRGNRIGNRGAGYLASAIKELPLLTLFDAARCRIGDEGANALGDALADLPLLNHVNFRRNRIEESGCIGLCDIIAAGKVQSLRLGHNAIGDTGAQTLAEALGENKNLSQLDLQNCSLSNLGAEALKQAAKDRQLDLDLDLDGNQIESSPEASKQVIHQLKHAFFSLLDDDRAIQDIDRIIQQTLDIGKSLPQKAGKIRLMLLQALDQVVQQYRLGLDSGKPNLRLAEDLLYQTYISNHPNPIIRAVFGEGEDPSTGKELTNVLESQLRKKDLVLGESGIRLLAPMMKKGWIHRLELVDQGLGPEAGRQLAIGVLAARNLTDLKLSGNPVGDTGLSALGTALISNSSLRRLFLINCGMGEKGCDDFAAGLAVNRTLLHLELEEPQLSDSCVALILNSLRQNRVLRRLELRDVEIGPKAATALGGLLAENRTLQILVIERSAIDESEAKLVAKGLDQNRHLTELHLPGCSLSDEAALAIDKSLRDHPTIELFNISQNEISSGAQATIRVASGNRYFKSF